MSSNSLFDISSDLEQMNNSLEFLMLADKAIFYSINEGTIKPSDSELIGMDNIKEELLKKFKDLQNTLFDLSRSQK